MKRYYNQAQKVYGVRYQNQSLDQKIFAKNPLQIASFLNDKSNYFYKDKQNFQSSYQLDLISPIDLQKVVAPQPIKKQIQKELPIIKLKQQKCSSEQKDVKLQNKNPKTNQITVSILKQTNPFIIIQSLTQTTPMQDKKEITQTTRCQNRIINLQWVRNCLDYMRRQQSHDTFRKVFSFVQKQTLIDFQFKARKQLFALIQQFTPKCLRRQNRVSEMFLFFKYLIIKIYQAHDAQQNAQMFRQLKTFNAVLCLSCDIFNFAYSSVVSSYRRECQIFEIPLIQALKPINWIGKNVDKPVELNNYLYALQKRIVIKQIWQDQTGYNLIKSQQQFNESSSIGYNDMIVWKRLLKHIYDRIQQLSKQVELQYKLVKRIYNIVEIILKQKPFLLHKNKIDQIIICCMTSFLSINQIHQQKTLEKVFKDYGRMDLSNNQNSNGMEADGREMTLSEFYNQVFLTQIQDLVDKNNSQTDFLLTPIRQLYQSVLKKDVGMTPFAKKYPQKNIEGQNGQQIPKENINDLGFSKQGMSNQPLASGLTLFKNHIIGQNISQGGINLSTGFKRKLILLSSQQQKSQRQKQEMQQEDEQQQYSEEQRDDTSKEKSSIEEDDQENEEEDQQNEQNKQQQKENLQQQQQQVQQKSIQKFQSAKEQQKQIQNKDSVEAIEKQNLERKDIQKDEMEQNQNQECKDQQKQREVKDQIQKKQQNKISLKQQSQIKQQQLNVQINQSQNIHLSN